MVSFRKAEKQAQLSARALGRESRGTERNYQTALKGVATFLKTHKLEDLKHLTEQSALRYLAERSQLVGQKTLDLDRQAMQAQLGHKLPVIKSELSEAEKSRAYTLVQAQLVATAQTPKHALSTALAMDAGLRAHELLTLRPVAEQARDTHREYRFAGRSGTALYTVEGKGGLCREVAISHHLAEKLEALRLDSPRQVYDRDIGYKQYYDIGGGHNWSSSFSKASDRALGWSNGAHGLRHTYAQERMNTLQGIGYNYENALEVVSQEMGHFRPEITLVYLR